MIHTALRGTNLGADFYTFWLAGKAMLLHHSDPYGAEVTLQSQMGIYGRPALPGEDQVAFAYPPYSVLALLPVVFLPFDWAYAGWLSLNLVILLTLLYVLFRCAPRPLSLTALLLFPVAICLATGNFSVLIGAIILFFFGVIALGKNTSPPAQVAAGALLAWATVKPQFTWLFIIFILVYAVRQRLRLFLGMFFGSLLACFAFSFLFVPGWVGAWLGRVQQYAGYVHSRPTLSEFLGLFLSERATAVLSGTAFVICLGLTALLLAAWWKSRSSWFEVFAWIGLVTYLFHLHGISYEQMTFLAPLTLWTGQQARWKSAPVLLFWFGSIIISWLAFALGTHSIAVDRSPVLFNAIWVAWLLFGKENLFTAKMRKVSQSEEI